LKLLFDANLSPKLVGRLAELFPGSVHVFDTGLARSTPDERIWEYAAAEGFTIVTADSDFLDNCDYSTSEVERVLRRNAVLITELQQSKRGVLTIRNTT
jgi:predicted nuclease of predicted toxin-antitoxin system